MKAVFFAELVGKCDLLGGLIMTSCTILNKPLNPPCKPEAFSQRNFKAHIQSTF